MPATHFSNATCPEWPELSFRARWRIQIDLNHPKPREEGVEIQALLHFSEPPALMASHDEVAAAAANYDIILTTDERLVAAWPQAIFFPFGHAWLEPCRYELRPGVSFIFSEGASSSLILPGYEGRVAVLESLARPGASPVEVFYGVARPMRLSSRALIDRLIGQGRPCTALAPDRAAKAAAFGMSHQIVIENVRARNYFSEKIVDCLVRGVTPIYVGCPNIGDYFDADGVFQCVDADEAVAAAEAVCEGRFTVNTAALDRNAELAAGYMNVPQRIRDAITVAALRRDALRAAQDTIA